MAESMSVQANEQISMEEGARGDKTISTNSSSLRHLDQPDAHGSSFFKGEEGNTFEAKMPVGKDDIYYKMDHKSRGIALILNHEEFKQELNLEPRKGTHIDCNSLKRTFEKLGFGVNVLLNLSIADIKRVLEDVSEMDHSDNDCFVLACLTHGSETYLYAHDTLYNTNTLWQQFTADKCPSLAGKPKLFFIQACHGHQTDPGVTMRLQTDSSPSYRLPVHADFLISFAAVPGYKSYRNSEFGSSFVQALCAELDRRSASLDILTLLTLVNHKVAVDFETYSPTKPEIHQKKQIPCTWFMLTRLLKFTENKPKVDAA